MKNNPLKEWGAKRRKLVVWRVLEAGFEFTVENIPAIVAEMGYKIQREKNPQDCPCYSSWPCHLNVDNLNCFLCDCPNYDTRIRDSLGFIGGCKRNGNGEYFERFNPVENGVGNRVWDCSNCIAYHSTKAVEAYLRDNLHKYQKIAEAVRKGLKTN